MSSLLPSFAFSSNKEGKAEALDDIVVEFANWGTDAGLSDAVDAFVTDHCGPFAGVDIAAEQPLEWTALHEKFVEIIDHHLDVFCKQSKTTAEVVFQKLQGVNSNKNISQGLVPQMIKMCEYDFFIR